MMKQCQLPSCGKWFEATSRANYCPGACTEAGAVLRKEREQKDRSARVRSTTKGRNAGYRHKHDSDIVAQEQTAFISKDEAHNASDIMHAPADQAVRMINRILSGRDVYVGVR